MELTKTYSETQNTHAFHTKTYSNFIIYRKAGGAPLNGVQRGAHSMCAKVQENIGEKQEKLNAQEEINILSPVLWLILYIRRTPKRLK